MARSACVGGASSALGLILVHVERAEHDARLCGCLLGWLGGELLDEGPEVAAVKK
jgi:hypothetical protein